MESETLLTELQSFPSNLVCLGRVGGRGNSRKIWVSVCGALFEILTQFKTRGPFLESTGNLPGPISRFLNVFFADYTVILQHGSWPMFS